MAPLPLMDPLLKYPTIIFGVCCLTMICPFPLPHEDRALLAYWSPLLFLPSILSLVFQIRCVFTQPVCLGIGGRARLGRSFLNYHYALLLLPLARWVFLPGLSPGPLLLLVWCACACARCRGFAVLCF